MTDPCIDVTEEPCVCPYCWQLLQPTVFVVLGPLLESRRPSKRLNPHSYALCSNFFRVLPTGKTVRILMDIEKQKAKTLASANPKDENKKAHSNVVFGITKDTDVVTYAECNRPKHNYQERDEACGF